MLNQLALGWSIFWRIFYMEIRATTINYHWSWFVFSSWKLLWINLGNISMWNIVVLVGKNAIKSWTSLPHAHFSQAWSPTFKRQTRSCTGLTDGIADDAEWGENRVPDGKWKNQTWTNSEILDVGSSLAYHMLALLWTKRHHSHSGMHIEGTAIFINI